MTSLSRSIRRGIRAARKRGVPIGRPLTVGKHADAIRSLSRSGLGVRAIARELGVSSTSVSRILRK